MSPPVTQHQIISACLKRVTLKYHNIQMLEKIVKIFHYDGGKITVIETQAALFGMYKSRGLVCKHPTRLRYLLRKLMDIRS